MKFGGTSVGTVERIQAVADRVVRAREGGDHVIVVVSAMGDTTDDLTAMALRIADVPDPREMDMLLTAGERIAMSLLGIALNARGCRAASYTGSQAGIITDTQHGKAKIVEIRPKRVVEALEAGNVVVLAGFQGLSTRYEITTLGRGAADLTAVAMAAEAINVDMIVQNVSRDGTTDMSFTAPLADLPRLEGVLDALARDIGADGFSVDPGIAKLSLVGAGMKSHPGVAADMFDVLAGEGINIEMISTSPIRISCVIRKDLAERALRAVHERFGLAAGDGS